MCTPFGELAGAQAKRCLNIASASGAEGDRAGSFGIWVGIRKQSTARGSVEELRQAVKFEQGVAEETTRQGSTLQRRWRRDLPNSELVREFEGEQAERQERWAPRNRSPRRREHLEEPTNPKKGATVKEANYQAHGTRLRVEKSLEVEARVHRPLACG